MQTDLKGLLNPAAMIALNNLDFDFTAGKNYPFLVLRRRGFDARPSVTLPSGQRKLRRRAPQTHPRKPADCGSRSR
ncbi:hypothetical protein DUT91_23450 [Phyllobacterium salinisoli]|uniref:Uncharacterized protein n=1 Tax=Phyllobacterium salinisoli TaxID=1899321 RepID=A0A368JWI7_9HYPH|nr:hypothetical protein DUT91_23450 [Phyllobacterium salinisoli]